MLHEQADAGDAQPAAEAHEERFAAGFDQFNDICIQSDGRHGQDDKEFAQFLQRFEEGRRHTETSGSRCDEGSQNEVNDEEREGLFEGESGSGVFW